MKIRSIIVTAMSGLCLVASHGHAQSAPAVDETQKSAAAVIAVDNHWGEAENSGDVAYLDRLLLPEYRSVNPNGTVHPKAALLAHARKNLEPGAAAAAAAATIEYRKTHPHTTSVVLQGNTAVATFASAKPGSADAVMSCDIFVYIDGHWHAIYSQHSSAQ